MIFSSYTFIFIFLPIVLLVYHLIRKTGKIFPLKVWLVISSLVFYALGQPDYILMFVLSLLLNYFIMFLMGRTKSAIYRRILLMTAVLWNISLLIYFKYTNFIITNINRISGADFSLLTLILPIGISFFTFQILAFTIDYYRGKADCPSFLDYLLFVSFFPQLIVGPVVMHDELIPQIEGGSLLTVNGIDIQRGIYLFSMGCAKKSILANPLITYASEFYSSNISDATQLSAWGGVLAFTFAYYFDFSGYIDMARGLGFMFGVRLPVNFDSPYKARNFADFWRRWNITISRFFNNTIFANLFSFGDRIPKLVFATLATFFVSGIWHGAGWNFILWGVVNGIFVCMANIMMLYRIRLPGVIAYPLTFVMSVLVRVIFDSSSISQAISVYSKMFDFSGYSNNFSGIFTSIAEYVTDNLETVIILAICAVICFFLPNSNKMSERDSFSAKDAAFASGLFVASLACMGRVSTFLYFNF